MTPEELNKLLEDKPKQKKRAPRYKKSEAVKKLEAVVWERKQQEAKNNPHAFPYPTQTKYTDKDANGLTRCVIDYINLSNRCFAYRVNNTGVFDPKTQKFRKSNTVAGIADISACVGGTFVQIEVKHGKDRQSDGQKKFQARCERAGGVYIIARNFETFITDFKTLFVS